MPKRRYIQIDGELIEVDLNYVPISNDKKSVTIIPDIKPYKSMIDGSIISSRSKHREHLRQHGCIEVGNDSSVMNPVKKPLESPKGLKECIIEAARKHKIL